MTTSQPARCFAGSSPTSMAAEMTASISPARPAMVWPMRPFEPLRRILSAMGSGLDGLEHGQKRPAAFVGHRAQRQANLVRTNDTGLGEGELDRRRIRLDEDGLERGIKAAMHRAGLHVILGERVLH